MPVDGCVIGIDVGGSKTHGLRVQHGTVRSEAFSRSANISSVGVVEATRQLDLLLDRLGRDDVAAVCVGTAGASTAERTLDDLLRDRFPGVPVRVVPDTQLCLAAAGLAEGAVIVSGTGSAAWGQALDGRHARAGGWGYLLGDEGGGYGVARAAVQHVLHRADADLPVDTVGSNLLRVCQLHSPGQLLDRFYQAPSRREWAGRAALVFALAEAGDEAATAIVQRAAAELVQAGLRVCRRLGLAGPVILAGGLAVHQPLLQRAVRDGLAAAGIDQVRVLHDDPVHGAVMLAQALLTDDPERSERAG